MKTAKVKFLGKIIKSTKTWHVLFVDKYSFHIPKEFIESVDHDKKEIKISTDWLDLKRIEYKK